MASKLSDPSWEEVKQFVEKEINDLRVLNDTPKLENETASIRGEIKAFQKLLDLEVKPSEKVVGSTDYL